MSSTAHGTEYSGIEMPRKPTTLTDDQKAQVEALAAYLTQEQIADYLGVTRQTFLAIMERDPSVSLHYKKGKANAISSVANGLLQKARDGDTASAIFYLKTQAGWRETQKLEHSQDGSMAPQLVVYIPDDETD